MGGFLEIFKGLLGGDPIRSISDLVAEFKLSPEQKAQFQQAVGELELRREQIEAAREQAITEVQGQNLRAETASEDVYVRRARPTFLYAMIAAIAMDLIVFPLVNLASGKGLAILEIPPAYLELFGVAFLGYTGARTWEKVSAAGKDSK